MGCILPMAQNDVNRKLQKKQNLLSRGITYVPQFRQGILSAPGCRPLSPFTLVVVVVTRNCCHPIYRQQGDNMAAKKVSPEEWAVIRKHWEEDPALNYAQLAAQVGMTRQAIKQRADREGWQKSLRALSIEQAAHSIVDERRAKVTENAEEAEGQAPSVYSAQNPEPMRAEQKPVFAPIDLTQTPEQAAVTVLDGATKQRADLIERQQREWNNARALVYDAIRMRGKKGSLESARYAKTVCEALKVLQDGERAAFALDPSTGTRPQAPGATIIVHQQQGVKIGS
jgi:hypothetical protein